MVPVERYVSDVTAVRASPNQPQRPLKLQAARKFWHPNQGGHVLKQFGDLYDLISHDKIPVSRLLIPDIDRPTFY